MRWVYPGLLFWLLLPLAFNTVDQKSSFAGYANFYGNAPVVGHVGLIIVSGFLIYLAQRYLIHEMILVLLFRPFGVGASANFKGENRFYPKATGRLMWTRFGQRPTDATEPGERAETRFERYLANRTAALHALGTTWMNGLILYGLGVGVSERSAFTGWHWGQTLGYALLLLAIFLGYLWHAFIVARAEQHHYQIPTSE
ncbi:MAG: hypothetical protein BZY88_16810 [SAR202 cluster bacterium Io17-Chloro-G9]|nr:MAG: hypothetical protein BZY88_16810 [SAR202 cluster bacterium Io17-Chloro-G9]